MLVLASARCRLAVDADVDADEVADEEPVGVGYGAHTGVGDDAGTVVGDGAGTGVGNAVGTGKFAVEVGRSRWDRRNNPYCLLFYFVLCGVKKRGKLVRGKSATTSKRYWLV